MAKQVKNCQLTSTQLSEKMDSLTFSYYFQLHHKNHSFGWSLHLRKTAVLLRLLHHSAAEAMLQSAIQSNSRINDQPDKQFHLYTY